MQKVCKYCGKIHAKDFICSAKPENKRIRNGIIDNFRNTKQWQKKREDIKRRDKYICQACYHNLHRTVKRINTEDLSVHHIIKIEKNFDLRLEDNNLITLCRFHHELAEKGIIKPKQLTEIIKLN